MMRSLFSGISGLRNHQTRMDVIGNNVSNVNTTGFKASRTIFQDIFSQTLQGGMANTVAEGGLGGTNPVQVGLGIRLSTVDVMHTAAPFGRTDNPFDMMIENDGFFVVQGPEGNLFTRVGNFGLDSEGFLVTSEGMLVLGRAREMIYVPPVAANTLPIVIPTTLETMLIRAIIDHGTDDAGAPLEDLTWAADETAIRAHIAGLRGAAQTAIGADVPAYDATAAMRALLDAILPGGFPEAGEDHFQPARGSSAAPGEWGVGMLEPIQLRVDGPTVGLFTDLLGFNVANNGMISVIIDNRRVDIAQLNLAVFANNNGLERAGNSLWRETASSGDAVITFANEDGAGSINGGGLEMSNVDLASEFTEMIITQRGYQANSRIITVSDSLLEELVNLKR